MVKWAYLDIVILIDSSQLADSITIYIYIVPSLNLLLFGIYCPDLYLNNFRHICSISRRLDHVPNEDILPTVGRRPLINSVRRRQLGWLGSDLRRDEREPAKIFALYTPEHGKAKQGKPPNTYLKQIASLLFGDTGQWTVYDCLFL